MVGKGRCLLHIDTRKPWLRTEETAGPTEGDTSEATDKLIRT